MQKLIRPKDYNLIKVASGFQHSVFLSDKGQVYGCGKPDKLQLGDDYLQNYQTHNSYKDKGLGINSLNFKNIEGRIVDIKAGKYHSAFLTGKNWLKTKLKREIII